ncbi:MAG: hypothetical protein CFE32_21005, partial [Alphaproteobacteria bacterium PA3]
MKQWLGPAAVALLVAAAAWQGGLSLATYGLMEVAVRRTAADTGFNKMRYNALATPENQPIVRPSPDLAYAPCANDLKAGPVEVT